VREKEFQRVMGGLPATPRSDEVEEGGGKVEVVVGSRGEEPLPHSTPESDYSQKERTFIADAADERDDPLLGSLVRSGQVKLRTHRQEPPPPPSDEQVVTSAAVKALDLRKQQLAEREAELADFKISRASLQDLAVAQERFDRGEISESELLAEQQRQLDRVEQVEDDELRHQTLESAAAYGYVEPDLYDTHVEKLQRAYLDDQAAEYRAQVEQAEQEQERDVRTMEAVIATEEARLNALPELAQGIARQMVEQHQDALAGMPTRELYESLAFLRHSAILAAASITEDHTSSEIVKAFPGRMRPGWEHLDSRKDRRELDAHGLFLARDPWTADTAALAKARAQAEVERDIRSAVRAREHGLTGKEQADLARAKLAARMTK
jgi:hypothetical protein